MFRTLSYAAALLIPQNKQLHIKIPGVHSEHPSFPFDELLEKVPTGHGKSEWYWSSVKLLGILLNPEDISAEINATLSWFVGLLTLTASVPESTGFLGIQNISHSRCYNVVGPQN